MCPELKWLPKFLWWIRHRFLYKDGQGCGHIFETGRLIWHKSWIKTVIRKINVVHHSRRVMNPALAQLTCKWTLYRIHIFTPPKSWIWRIEASATSKIEIVEDMTALVYERVSWITSWEHEPWYWFWWPRSMGSVSEPCISGVFFFKIGWNSQISELCDFTCKSSILDSLYRRRAIRLQRS